MKLVARLSVLLIFGTLVGGCARMTMVKPPEHFSPQAVEELVADTSVPGEVKLSWKSASIDRDGKELRSMNGYRVMRAALPEGTQIDLVEWEELSFVEDGHIKKRDELRKQLRAQNRPSRRADVDDEDKRFAFTDQSRPQGVTALYQIIPVNQGSIEGMPSKIVFLRKGVDVPTYIESLEDKLL